MILGFIIDRLGCFSNFTKILNPDIQNLVKLVAKQEKFGLQLSENLQRAQPNAKDKKQYQKTR